MLWFFSVSLPQKEGINNCLIFVFSTSNMKLIILFVFIQGSSDQAAVEEASATAYPPFGRLSLHRFVNQNNSVVLPAYHTGIFLSFSDFLGYSVTLQED